MLQLRGVPVAALGLVLGALVACAPSPDGVDPHPAVLRAELPVEVYHNLPLGTSVHVELRGAGGEVRMLGNVSPGQTRRFALPDLPAAGQYVLVAQAADGRRWTSRPFTLARDRGIRWDISGNIVSPIGG